MLLTAVAWCALVCNKSNIYCPADKTTPAKKDEPHGPPMLKKGSYSRLGLLFANQISQENER